MKQAEPVKIQGVVAVVGFVEQLQRAFQRVKQVGADAGGTRQVKPPAAGLRHMGRVPPAVSMRLDGGQPGVPGVAAVAQGALHVAPNPPFLKPAHVAELPQGRVDSGQHRHRKVHAFQGGLELAKKLQRMIARIHERQ